MAQDVLKLLREALDIETEGIVALADRLDDSAVQAVETILACTGRVIVTGMGKMGLIGRKIAATLSSTGTPAFFLHPAEAYHGDLGIIASDDVVLAMSNSGQTEEVTNLLPHIKRFGVKIIAMTGQCESTLARHADVIVDCGVAREACPMNVAPTASTTAALAMGDAIAVALIARRGFTSDDYAIFHPGGSLGRKLLLHVRDIMHAGEDIPTVQPGTALRDAIVEMSSKRLGTAIVTENGTLRGIFTDGDLRRLFEAGGNPLEKTIDEVMVAEPKRCHPGDLAAEALRTMEEKSITALPVVDEDNNVVGIVHLHDLIRAGLA